MSIKGGCYCGAMRYEAGGEPVMKAQCHCRECQYISGGGPNYFMMMPAGDFVWTQGTPATFTRTDIEGARTREYCATCGTHMTTRLPGRPLVVVKVGTLDDPAGAYGGPDLAIFTCDAQPFHQLPDGKPAFDKLPTR